MTSTGPARLVTATLLSFLGLLLAATLTAIPAAGAATPGDSQQRAAKRYYGAIAVGVDNVAGISYNYNTRKGAERRAKKECKKRSDYRGSCVVVGWVSNGCGAVAVKRNSDGFVYDVKYAYARNRQAAKRKAKKNFGGFVRATTCTAR